MAFSIPVRLSVNVTPVFPKRCVVCSEKAPDTTVGVGDLLIGWLSFFSDIPEGWGHVSVPIHKHCRRPFRLRRWLTRIAYLALAFLIWFQFGEQIDALLPDLIRRLGRKIILVVLIMPFVILEMFFPPRFDFTATKYYVTFEFADPRYAAAFAKQNNEPQRYAEIKS